MENTLMIALSRQSVLRRKMDIIANNIANMNTTGFKGEKILFVEHLVRSRGGNRIMGERLAYVRDIATMRDTSEGPLEATSNPLDVALSGKGYFVIGGEAGERYTRNGHFRLDEGGQLVTQVGDPVLAEGGAPFFFSPEDSEIDIARDGTVSTNNGELGKLRIVEFDNDQELMVVAGGLYITDRAPVDVERPDVVQHMLEGSNVQPIIEITKMIETSRSYDATKKMIEREDERLKMMIKDLPKVN